MTRFEYQPCEEPVHPRVLIGEVDHERGDVYTTQWWLSDGGVYQLDKHLHGEDRWFVGYAREE